MFSSVEIVSHRALVLTHTFQQKHGQPVVVEVSIHVTGAPLSEQESGLTEQWGGDTIPASQMWRLGLGD